jgi:hypothetical protein
MTTEAPREATSVREICDALSPMVHLVDAYKRLLLLLYPDATSDPNGMIPRAEAAIGALDTLATNHDALVEALREIAEHAKCAGFGRCDMVSRCGACTARHIARRVLASLTDEGRADGQG